MKEFWDGLKEWWEDLKDWMGDHEYQIAIGVFLVFGAIGFILTVIAYKIILG